MSSTGNDSYGSWISGWLRGRGRGRSPVPARIEALNRSISRRTRSAIRPHSLKPSKKYHYTEKPSRTSSPTDRRVSSTNKRMTKRLSKKRMTKK